MSRGLRRRLLARTAVFIAFVLSSATAFGEWQRDAAAIAWRQGTDVVWRFSFDANAGKPFFDPLRVGGSSLTSFRPQDHPWHYGLWFSWKYVNGVNYWEEDRATGRAEGATRWTPPAIDARPDGSATISLDLSYVHPSGRVDMSEHRELRVSALRADGGYSIDWHSRFVAGKEGALLDRTPMPGEPDGKVNGGYAGLGIRLAGVPLAMSCVTPDGPVSSWENDRARPAVPAVACNFADGGEGDRGARDLQRPRERGRGRPLVSDQERRHALRVCCRSGAEASAAQRWGRVDAALPHRAAPGSLDAAGSHALSRSAGPGCPCDRRSRRGGNDPSRQAGTADFALRLWRSLGSRRRRRLYDEPVPEPLRRGGPHAPGGGGQDRCGVRAALPRRSGDGAALLPERRER